MTGLRKGQGAKNSDSIGKRLMEKMNYIGLGWVGKGVKPKGGLFGGSRGSRQFRRGGR